MPPVTPLRAVATEPLRRRVQPASGAPLLQVTDVTRRFGGLVAVNNVSFAMQTGEILALIGPNGAGKSTMFNLVTGVLSSDNGSVKFLDAMITNLGPRHVAAAGLGRTFQHVKLRPAMSALDNVLLGTYLRTRSGFVAGALRLDRREEGQAVADAMLQLQRVGLGTKAEELAGNLSLGSQRILEVARSLAADPILILLDEPAAGLRKPEKEALAVLLRQLRSEGVSVLLVEHDMDFVMGLVDRIVVMEFGTKLMEGTPVEVRANPKVQEAYLGGVA